MKCDLCIIGSGPAGYHGAVRAAMAGMEVCLVEMDQPGGTCLNRGCIPTKALRHCADVLAMARAASGVGVDCGRPALDFAKAAEHRDRVTGDMVSGLASLLKAKRIKLIKGRGKLAGPGKVEVTAEQGIEEVWCKHVVLATGSAPAGVPVVDEDEQRVFSPEGALQWQALPESLLIVGGGVIGCEFAGIMAEFGVKVSLVEVMDRLLLNEDRETARAVHKALLKKGVEFFLNTTIEKVSEGERGLACSLDSGVMPEAERMLVCVGRKPKIDDLGLAECGVDVGKSCVRVDERGRTSASWAWAAGDVIGPPFLAHAASHEVEVAVDNILGKEREFEHEVIPSVVYVRPEVASVGLLEDAAKAEGIAVDKGRFSYAASGMARCMAGTDGFAKVIVSKEDGRILGATVVGAHASDLIAELALAVKSGLGYRDIMDLVHAHPSLSEIVMEAAADAKGLAVHKASRRPK